MLPSNPTQRRVENDITTALRPGRSEAGDVVLD